MGDALDLQTITRTERSYDAMLKEQSVPALTILHHPDMSRVGEICRLPALDRASGRIPVSRASPDFAAPYLKSARPLATPFISRKPVLFTAGSDGSITSSRRETRTRVDVMRQPVEGEVRCSPDAIRGGVVVSLARDVVLLLHRCRPQLPTSPPLTGWSATATPSWTCET